MGISSPAQAVRLQIIFENLSPTGGVAWSPLWFGFHDGSFDLFDPGETAASGLEFLAEEGGSGAQLSADLADRGGVVFGSLPSSDRPTDLFAAPDFFPGEVDSVTVEVDGNLAVNRFFSYASMLVPSNDGFIANNNPQAFQLFDAQGRFQNTTIAIIGANVWDGGTEVNDEDPNTTPGLNHVVGAGIPENGVITPHLGYSTTNPNGV
ncbi:MAG: hypothetical protein HC890_05395 [Chloroflexaceae bacterium]|nr:hypothetical protein [Chloroflexaceae bacterium]